MITDEQIKFIAHCKSKRVEIQGWQAEAFLKARKVLETNPKDEIGKDVVRDFTHALQAGQPVEGFAQFLI